ncbi:methyl-accepting chemotaxis protein [Lonsdalea britannica]|uniref:Methyl-accepting chemotaxis protein n=1 Tax=Lonsdalea britannica TaxID=1082704 RepID=A0AAD0WK70_9GAMM|nr:methyl-accepting chemotaxis protein [Lonsdalea britannica]AXW86511.1 methyl-accepting chemotaxis protein [Lonsdalea britannica]
MAIKFENIKVGRKLGLGFSLILALTLLIAAVGMMYIGTLKDRFDKATFSAQINDEVNQARYYRVLYSAGYNPDAIKNNSKHINNIVNLVSEAKNKSWYLDYEDRLEKISEAIVEYQKKQKDYVDAVNKKDQVRQSWNISDTQTALNAFEQQTRSEGNFPLQLQLANLDLKLTNIRYQARGLLLALNQEAEKPLIAAVEDTEQTLNQLLKSLPAERQSQLTPIVTSLSSYKAQVLAYLPAYQEELKQVDLLGVQANNLISQVTGMVENETHATQKDINEATLWLSLTALVTLLLGIGIALYISRQITQPLNQTVDIAENIAAGDLTMPIVTTRRDELGMLLNSMAKMKANLHNIIDDIRLGVSQINTAAREIVAGNDDLSSRTESQAAAVEETAASMEQLTSTVKQNASNAHHANKLVLDATQTAQSGGKLVEEVVKTMSEIEGSSKRIAEITSVINGIAFQTNILALNAAVEAARAGEQGRGFAVVAGEVRNLAQRSSQAAKEIEGLISTSVNQVGHGARLVNDAGTTMHDIVTSVTHVHDIMGEITVASDEQSRGIAQVNEAIVDMDSTTQQNAALVQESTAAASSLEEQAIVLSNAIAVFRLSSSPERENNGQQALTGAHAQQLTYNP